MIITVPTDRLPDRLASAIVKLKEICADFEDPFAGPGWQMAVWTQADAALREAEEAALGELGLSARTYSLRVDDGSLVLVVSADGDGEVVGTVWEPE